MQSTLLDRLFWMVPLALLVLLTIFLVAFPSKRAPVRGLFDTAADSGYRAQTALAEGR